MGIVQMSNLALTLLEIFASLCKAQGIIGYNQSDLYLCQLAKTMIKECNDASANEWDTKVAIKAHMQFEKLLKLHLDDRGYAEKQKTLAKFINEFSIFDWKTSLERQESKEDRWTRFEEELKKLAGKS